AMKSQDVTFWKEAINDEMDSIMGNNTWVLADLPPDCKPLGIDYFDTYAPVARISTIRLLTVMASIHNLIFNQMDVKTTFLNGELEEEVYMNQPQGFVMPGNENKVCKLIKSLYGLKQAPKKFDETGKRVIICLYVDDMLIFGTNQVQVDLTKEFLSSRFSMKDIGEADVILVSTPMDTSEKLMPNNGQALSKLEYSRVIGCLIYVRSCTRPDIAFVVGKLSRYTSNPGTQHWQAIQRVLTYLKKTMDYRLTYTGYPLVLEGYTNASWISNTEDNSRSAPHYGKIEEKVYVCQPPGFEDPDFTVKVYKVEKALYGLHQAPRAWYETLSTYLLDNRFQKGKIDKTLFIKRHKGDILLVQVYVDDIIFGLTKKELCFAFEKLMHEKFQMSSMGELIFFLGLQVKKKKDGIFISQDKYVEEILKKFRFTEVKTASTPMETPKPLLKDEDGEEVDVHMYRLMIGSLMCLTSSRPDIMFAVSYTDSDYAGASLDRKSTSGGKAKKSVKLMMEKLFRMELELMLVTQS
ncbi:zinc finger, CCHC-type containing protein, partial [Tanacetum coccineum]